MHEHCGVVGIFSFEEHNVVPMLLLALEALQHRGQEAWGIAVPGAPPFKRAGIVSQFVEKEPKRIAELNGKVGIGHVRYSTTAKSTLRNAHPIRIGSHLHEHGFCIAHNGTLERELLIECLSEEGISSPQGKTDTELMGLGLYRNIKQGKSWVESFEDLNPYLNGAFSTVILTSKGELIAARDEKGFRPLCLGWHEETSSYIVASESCALDIIGARLIRDIEPGEIIKINKEGLTSERFSVQERHAHCPFEYTYFANPSSRIEGINVYMARKNIGRLLAEMYPLDGDIIVPVPDSARPAALGYSERSGIPFEEGLMKDRYRKKGSWRSFIEPKKREEVVSNIMTIKEAVDGKRIILIDDSIIRGTSSRIIVGKKLKSAKEVSLLLTFPPVMYPCYAGIDFPTQKELLAYRVCKGIKDLDEINRRIAKHIGVSFLGYNSVEGLSRGIGIPLSQLCLSCTTGDYSCLKRKPRFKTRKEMKG
ncbi:amidophosphoribosyltransferase [Candidatus Bathyarchaeota archaeon]|nr:MAG: amidophosphoribosyltransferase [Candidatus Bathyarchaeota archaeon]